MNLKFSNILAETTMKWMFGMHPSKRFLDLIFAEISLLGHIFEKPEVLLRTTFCSFRETKILWTIYVTHMAGIYQEVHPYQPNVTKSFAKRTFSFLLFFKELHESFCVLSMKGSVPRICKNIFKKVSQKNRNFRLKIGYNSGCNIKYTWLLKVEYLLNGSMDLYEILNLSS